MKIAYLSSSTIPSPSANSVQVMNMCQAFAANGHNVVLYAKEGLPARNDDEIFRWYGTGECFDLRLISAPRWWGIGGLLYGMKVKSSLNASLFNPEILYGRNIYALLACANSAGSIYFEAHAPPANMIRRLIENRLFRKPAFRKLICISQALKEEYRKVFPGLDAGKILVAPDGACHHHAERELPAPGVEYSMPGRPDALKVGYAGGLYPGKGVEMILSSCRALPQLDFHIAGGTADEVAALKNAAHSDNIYFRGYISPCDVQRFLSSCDILLAPYQRMVGSYPDGKGNIAGWMSPLKIFEYMASRRPIVASRLPVLQEILHHEDNALLADPENPAEWHAALLRLAESPSSRRSLADKAFHDFSENYTWEHRAREVISNGVKG